MNNPHDTPQSGDYRESHINKSANYDEFISSSALDAYMDRWEARYTLEILSRLYPINIPRYLDFACGTGRITQRIAPFALEAYGVDISPSMLELARKKCPTAQFVHADLTQKDIEFGLFDLVTSFRFFGNAQDELRSSALQAINRHLHLNGHLIINNHRNPKSILALISRLGGDPGHGEDLSHAKLKSLLESNGFKILETLPIGLWVYRYKLASKKCLESPKTEFWEKITKLSALSRWAPDSVIVAVKTKNIV